MSLIRITNCKKEKCTQNKSTIKIIMKKKTLTFSVFMASNALAERLIILSNISSHLPIEGTGLTISLVVLSCPFVCPFKCITSLDRTFVLYVHSKHLIGYENI